MIESVNVFTFSMKYIMFGQMYSIAIIIEIEVGSFSMCPISFKSLFSHTAWQVDVVAATYSAFAGDMLTLGCF